MAILFNFCYYIPFVLFYIIYNLLMLHRCLFVLNSQVLYLLRKQCMLPAFPVNIYKHDEPDDSKRGADGI